MRVVGDAVGPVFFHGLGAGQMPTASAVVADLIDMVVGRAEITFRILQLWSDCYATVPARDHARVPGRYYLRFDVEDRPGVMAEITGVLGRHGVSIASVIQHEQACAESGVVPLVIMTHQTTEGASHRATIEIDRLACVRPGSVRLRVKD
jgi:homoserine dehydrogenase